MNSELRTQSLDISGYRLTEQLYESRDSLVYRGYREADEQPVVLKIVQDTYPTLEPIAWFKREYQVTRNLNLAGVVKAYAFLCEQQLTVIVLEDFGGDSLARLGVAGKLELGEFLHLAIAITQILDQIHASDIIHKDINPSNIVLNPTTKVVKIIDFGISTVLSRENPTFCNPHVLEGTLPYMSPEQTGRMNRAIDYRSDFYSLGVTFYELLAGRLPFESDDPLELVHCHLAKQPPPLTESTKREIPSIIGEIVMKLMAKNPEDCYQSAYGIQADLESCLEQLQTQGQIDSFILGRHDISDKFHIPQKLYGREREIETLLAALEQVAGNEGDGETRRRGDTETRRHGDAETKKQFPIPKQQTTNNKGQTTNSKIQMILVSGYSGVGKSALVNEVYKPITAKRGNFISGKFDQYQRNIPYSALSQAFNQLCNYILSESTADFEQWRQKILAAVGNNGEVLLDVIPNLALVIGQQPTVAQVGLQAAQNRFNLVCQNFIKAICQPEHPLVLFIDDLQWADTASLRLFRTIMSNKEIQHLLIIGAYRDNEVDVTHPLMTTLEYLKQESGLLSSIHLENLASFQVNTLISEALACSATACEQLSDLVYTKTQGNPFFTIEFLRSLYREGLLSFNQTSRNWQWDISEIQAKSITDNVVKLMVGKISQLPPVTQASLQLAACIGNTFDLSTLGIISQHQPTQVLADLFPALQEGLIVQLNKHYKLIKLTEIDDIQAADEVRFKFLHDQVQQAAYYLIAQGQKQATHLQIGRLLANNANQEVLEEHIFDVVNHFHKGIELISNQQELVNLVKFNLLAGRQAKEATAYQSAVNYLTRGRAILGADSWQTEYELTLNLYLEEVEAQYLNTNYEQAEILTKIVLEQAKTLLDQLRVYETQIQFYIAQNKMLLAIDTGLQVLEKLGVPLVNHAPQKIIIEELDNLPAMTDSHQLAALRILSLIFSPSFIAKPELLLELALTQVNLCINYGNSPQAASAYVFYGLLLCGVLDDIPSGYQFGRLALRVLEQFDVRQIKCKVHTSFNACIRHWQEPLREAIEPLCQAIQIGLETGDIEGAGYAALTYCEYLFLSGEPLAFVQQQQVYYINIIQNLKQEFSLNSAQIWGQLTLNLSEKSAVEYQLLGELFDETHMLPLFRDTNNLTSLFRAYLAKTILSYLLKDYAGTVVNAQEASNYEQAVVGLLYVAEHCFYYSLALLAIYAATTNAQQREYLAQITANQHKLKNWAEHAPMNFQHKYELVEAEKARVLGQNWEATEFYERAIKGARDNQYLHEEALAYELAAEFYLAHNRLEIAQTYLSKAHYGYSCWQAWAKVKDLEERYPQFLAKNASRITTTTSGRDTKTAAALDLTSIIKASQVLSGEIVLDSLLTKMLKIIIENAGAQKGYLLMETNGQWMIEASGKVNSEEVELWQSIPIETVSGRSNHPLIANAIVNYVIRTQESVVLNDATKEGNFTRTPYILKQQPKSLLCTPLLNQGKLLGILYLENNLTTGAFTPERLEVLNLLSSQAAIAMENAKLYAQVQANESRLNQFLEAMPVGVGVLDKHGRPYYINHKAQELLGKGVVKEATPDTIAEVYDSYIAGTNQLYPCEQLPIVRALKGESVTVDDLEIHAKDKIIPVEGWGAPIYDQQGNIVYALVAFQDITERKQTQQLLADYNRTLEAQVAKRTEALAESEERYRRIVETSNEGIWLLDTENRTTFVNPKMAQMLGYSIEAMQGMSIFAFLDEEGKKIASNNLKRRRQGISEQHDFKFRCKDGSDLWTIFCVTTIFDEVGQYIGVLGMVTDISDRKRTEEALRESQAQYQSLVDALPIYLYRTDTQGRFTFGNRAFLSYFGIVLEESVGKTAYDFCPQPLADKYAAENETIIQTGATLDIVEEVPATRDNPAFYLQQIKSPVRDENGQIIGTQVIGLDITERQLAQETLRWQAALLESMANASPLAFYVVDNRTDAILYFNHRFCEIWRLQHLEESMEQGELKNNELIPYCLELILDVPGFAESCKPLQSEENRAIVEDEIAFVDGRIIRRFSAQIRDEQDHYFGRLYIFENISDRKQAEAALQKALEAAEVANRAKNTFLASASHELRTPLNAILGFAQLMSHSPNLSPENQKHLGIIHQSGEHLLNLINNVLDMSKVEAGSITLNKTNFDLYRLLDDLEAMFYLKALEKKLQLVFECSSDIPQYLHTDQLKLRQVLINLINNAIKFTQKGSVLVRVSLVIGHWSLVNNKEQMTNDKGQTKISFEIQDTGIGIAPEELEKIFEPFVQASTSQQFQEGTGLGLAISRKFVQLMGGQITVSSKVGNGTLFKFDIPVSVVEAAAIQTKQLKRRVIALEPNQPCYRILIVDDRDYNRQLLVNLLSRFDFELKEACNGQKAVEVWENWQPHLIWMDLRMPVMDGCEATQQIRLREGGRHGDTETRRRRDAETPRHGDAETRRRIDKKEGENDSQFPIPNSPTINTIIIALAASNPEEERAVALAAGCDDFIRKPFQEWEIFEMMKNYIGVRYIYEKVASEKKYLPAHRDSTGIASPSMGLATRELPQGTPILTPTILASLPADWLVNFQQATVEGDLDLMLTFIEQIRQQNHHLADALASLANQFQFEELLALIEEQGIES